MNTDHLQPFLDAMQKGDKEGLAANLAEDMVIRSPIIVEPFEGKAKALGVLEALLGVMTHFKVTGTIEGEAHAAAVLAITVGDVEVEGVDHVHVNSEGLLNSMTIQWRPLPAVVAIQQKLAPVIGIPSSQLVEV